jgi:superfamily I DNA and/or RNA helicase
MGYDKTILDRMKTIESSYLLREQYRMNDKILSFSNFKFYNNQLSSSPTVANHSLENDTAIASFIDTSGCGFDENFNPEFRSYFNEGEYFILREHFEQNKEKYQGHSIGIIAPYAEQVRFLRTQIAHQDVFVDHDIEVDSIDGFQGQEKDIIYISLVRSNDQSNIGFLKDERRINVALTRARKKLIVIGDGATLGTQGLFLELIEHFEKHCTYQSAWEYMA